MNFTNTVQHIQSAAVNLANLEASIAQTKQRIEKLEAIAEGEAAFDPSLKNDKQRQYAAFKMLQDNPDYEPLLAERDRLTKEKAIATANLEYLRNFLSISKLAERGRIVTRLENCDLKDLIAA